MSQLYQPVKLFEQRIAEFTKSQYAIAVDTCTAALFLCCKYLEVKRVTIPKHTYCSVPCSIIHAGGQVEFEDHDWQGMYQLTPYPIWDAACRLKKNMYIPGSYMCLSFQYKKPLPIGRGGMILTDDAAADKWFRLARLNGREEMPEGEGSFQMVGWNMFMEPERASRGLMLMAQIKDDHPDAKAVYPDLSKSNVYR